MKPDPILEELHALRRHHAQQFGCDLTAMFADLKAEEQSSGRPLVARPGRVRDSHSAELIAGTRHVA